MLLVSSADKIIEEIPRDICHIVLVIVPVQRTEPVDAPDAENAAATADLVHNHITAHLVTLRANHFNHGKYHLLIEDAK